MARVLMSLIAAALVFMAGAQTANSQKSKGARPAGAHVGISIGDGNAVESKSGGNTKKGGGTNMRPWTTTHGSSGPRY